MLFHHDNIGLPASRHGQNGVLRSTLGNTANGSPAGNCPARYLSLAHCAQIRFPVPCDPGIAEAKTHDSLTGLHHKHNQD